MSTAKMGKDRPTFKIGDLVFAKVRGYPAWPAKITGIVDNRPNTSKYSVYFYGTAETATVFAKDIYSYKENKDKLGKPGKRKFFKEGLEEIEKEMRKIEYEQDSSVGLRQDSSPETTPVKKYTKKYRRPEDFYYSDSDSSDDEKIVKVRHLSRRDIEEYLRMESGKKKRSKAEAAEAAAASTAAPTPATPSTTPTAKSEQISRSGRVIKPKKFLYESKEETETKPKAKPQASATLSAPSGEPATIRGGRRGAPGRRGGRKTAATATVTTADAAAGTDPLDTIDLDDDGNVISPDMGRIMWAKTNCGQMIQIKLDCDRPATFKDDRARLMWERATEINAKRLKAEIESGDFHRADIKLQLRPTEEELTKLSDKQLFEKKRLRIIERKRGKLRWLKLETRLVDIDVLIKTCLQKSKVDIEKALSLMDELINMPLDPLMLKKHPQVVDTTKKLRQYIGNAGEWNLSSKEADQFNVKAHRIRQKANILFNKYTSLFAVTEPNNFWSYFLESVNEFTKLTRDMPRERVFGLIIDPSSPYYKDVCEDDKEEEEFKLKYNISTDRYFTKEDLKKDQGRQEELKQIRQIEQLEKLKQPDDPEEPEQKA